MADSLSDAADTATADRPQSASRPRTGEGIDADSYTAHRLQHASPQHLHLTTRRCFIGPIPEVWLSKHRKSWYKYRPHLSTYSSKTATFNAGHDVEDGRELTGLDGASRSTQFRGPSFPQPDDVGDEEEEQTVEDQGDGETSIVEPVPLTQESSRTKQVRFGNTKDSSKKKRHKGEPSMMSRITGASGKSRKSSAQSEGGESFVTARESNGSTSQAQNNGPGDSGNSTTSLLHHGSGDTDGTASAPSPSITPDSRLRAQTGDDGREDGARNSESQGASHGNAERPSRESQRAGQEAAVGLRKINPVSTGLVRFAIPEQPESPDAQLDGAHSRRSFRDFLKPKVEPGELIKAERMLVRVDWTKHELPAGYSENDSLKTESKAVEKWREFIVVCRRAAEETESDYILQMTKTRVITARDRDHARKSIAHEIPLDKTKTKISMFSSLDKTIVLWTPWKSGTRTYILRPSSSASSVEWFTFLNTTLGWKRADNLTIHVPDLNVTLNLSNPFQALEAAQYRALQNENTTQESLTSLAEGVVARDIIERCLDMLQRSPVGDILNTWVEHDIKVGLAWKRYDRLEWVHGANESRMYGSIAMQQSYDLELRPKQHYPTQAVSMKREKKTQEEPAPVEGFLVRLTSQKGRHSRLGKTFFKRLYYSTHNQFFCFSLPGKAMPPKPPKMPKGPNNDIPKASELAEKVPLIYSVNPFPVVEGRIEWLGGNTASRTKKEMDQYAYEESERKIKNLHDAQGYINLTNIVRIRKMKQDSAPQAPPDHGEGSGHDSAEEFSDEGQEPTPTQKADIERTFEITLRNGLVVRLQAYDKLARKEWVKRLRQLVKYWKTRVAADMELYKLVRYQNLQKLDIDEEMESILGQFAQKWEVSKSFASPELFNMCGISCCRAITMAGVLYRKPRLHSTFKRCSVILCHGKLLIFQSTLRAQSGVEIPHIHHERQELVDLKDTYVYSGLITENDLLYQNQTFDSNRPGHHALPRVYLEDNWTSTDEDIMTCFVIWHGKSKSWFKANAQQDDGNIKQNLRYVSSLGRPGRAMVFKCRSRAERDHWVMNINMEIERLQQAADIRVVSK